MAENDKNNHNNTLETTWKWFEFHANQRFSAFYYFLIIIGALSFGYIQSIGGGEQLQVLAPFLSFLGVLVSFAFYFLEIRNVELVNIGRQALRRLTFNPACVDYSYFSDDDICVKDKFTEDEIKAHKLDKKQALKDALGGGSSTKHYQESFTKHEFWLRLIYVAAGFVSIIAFFHSLEWFHSQTFFNLFLLVFVNILSINLFSNRGVLSPWKRGATIFQKDLPPLFSFVLIAVIFLISLVIVFWREGLYILIHGL